MSLPPRATCVIVGGGVVGCSLAYHLAKHGLKALLLEAHELAGGSTGRCAGGVRQQFSTHQNVVLGMESRNLLLQFADETGVDPGFRQIGYLFVGTQPSHIELFHRNVAMQQAAGLRDVTFLEPDAIGELVPGIRKEDLLGGTYCPSDGIASPNEVTTGYATAARRLGAHIEENAQVVDIEVTESGAFRVITGTHEIETGIVVDCAGAHAGAVGQMVGVPLPVLPYRRHIFVTEPLAEPLRIPMTVDFGTSFYAHPEGGGLLLGMSDPDEGPSFSTEVSWDFLEHLVEHAVWRLPALAGAGIKTGWAGLYEVTPDHQAIIGKTRVPGFWVSCGFSGHGFMQAPAAGAHLADAIVADAIPEQLVSFSLERFSSEQTEPELAVI